LRSICLKQAVLGFFILFFLGCPFPDSIKARTLALKNLGPSNVSIFMNEVRADELSAKPGPMGRLESCWSETDLYGKGTDKLIFAAPRHTRNIPPERTLPTLINPPLSPQMANSIRYVKLSAEKRLVAITFDLCEMEKEISGYDNGIVNYLRENKVKATFFAGGKWMRSHPDKTMQLMSDTLFEVGNHGWSHKNFRKLDKRKAEEQILWAQAQYELLWEELQKKTCFGAAGEQSRNIPRAPRVFRFPFGACTPESLAILQEIGLPAIQWDVVSGDPAKGQSAKAITGTVLKNVKPGSIVIFHANGRGHATEEALRQIIPKLEKSGFEFATVSELLAAGTPFTSSECYENRSGDNLRYDRIKTE